MVVQEEIQGFRIANIWLGGGVTHLISDGGFTPGWSLTLEVTVFAFIAQSLSGLISLKWYRKKGIEKYAVSVTLCSGR